MKSMDLRHFERKLLEKQRECQAAIAALEGEARGLGDGDVKDSTDDAAVEQGASEALDETGRVSRTLEQVESALRRIKDSSYGKCIGCGRPIGSARLEAVPWAEYCLEDQEKLDRRRPAMNQGPTL